MKLILTLTALFASASLALAADEGTPKKPGEGKRPNPEEMFKKLDANVDGSLSKDEYMAAPFAKKDGAMAEKRFTAQDTDKDGKLSKEEFAKRPEGGKGPKKDEAK